MTKLEELKAAYEAATPGEWKLLPAGKIIRKENFSMKTKLKDACMAALAMLLIILFPNMEDL